MPITNFPNGVSSFGAIMPSGGGSFPMNGKNHWWVSGNLGSDGQPGTSPDLPFKTMARAFAFIGSGDVIHFTGNLTEQISTPVGIFDVTIIGEGNRPRHADAHSGNNGYSGATWKTGGAATTPLLTIKQQGWKLVNILFSCPADSCGVKLFRDAGAGSAERDASHAHIIGCRFDGGQDHIQNVECAFVKVEGCLFRGATGTSYKGVAGAGVANPFLSQIFNNVFMDNANAVIIAGNQCVFQGNTFAKFTTKAIDLNGGTGNNIITGNSLWGTYSVGGGYRKANANDDWGGNWNTGVGVLTTVAPA